MSEPDDAHESDDDSDGDHSGDYISFDDMNRKVDEGAAAEFWGIYALDRERKGQAKTDADSMDFDRSFSSDSSG